MVRYLLFVLFCVLWWSMNAQEQVESYFVTASNQAVIFTGKEEPKYLSAMKNDPYLYTSEYREGVLYFDGITYPNVMLRLNQHTEELIILSPDKRFHVVVPTNRVDSAVIGSYPVFYNVPEKGVKTIPQGYYVRLHSGRFPVLKRETCFIQSIIKDMVVEYSFARRNKIYIHKDDIYHPVTGKRAVLKLFKSHKRELKRYIADNGLDFRNSPDASVAAVTRYYETLIP